tara:strand:- start:5294 stop:7267 length:1974 start_codon:yes stop_codon:yes gene_type:complete
VLYCCSYSNTSLAYTQQYNVGDTGPNGGQVTAVDVTSTVTGTEVALNGGFEETTTTTLYTETVTEQISTTETVTNTTTTTVETTTANQLNDINLSNGDWQAAGDYGAGQGGDCNYSGTLQADEFCTGAMLNVPNSNVANTNSWNTTQLGGGYLRPGPNGGYVELTQTLTEAEIQAGFDVNYGVTVESHTSNKSVPLCSATTGDCKDIFSVKLTLKGHRPNNLLPEYLYPAGQYETLTYSGTQTFNYTYSLGSNSYTRVDGLMELWGVDAGYHSRNFGPIFSDPYIKLTYDAVTLITEQITNIVLSNQETVYTTSETTMTSVFIGDPTTDTTPIEVDYTDVDSFEIEIVDADGGGIELEFTVEVDETSNTANVEMSSTNLDTGVVQVESIAEISLDFEMDTGATDMPEITVAEIEADIGSQIDSAVADAVAEIDAGPTENIEVASVNTSEGNTDGPESTQEVSETESSSTSESTVETENVQESSENAEQPVEESGSESEGSDSGDSDPGEDTSGSEAESEAGDQESSGSDSDSKESSSGGKKSDGKKGNDKSTKEQKREYVEKKIAEAKQKIATRILAAMADSYSAINEATKIALISSLADQENFNKYLAQKNADLPSWYSDVQVYADMPQLLDPAAVLYNMAQDKIMEEMIMMQYED